MKRFFCFIIAVFILFSIAFPCFAELREDGKGEWVSEGNDQAHWIDGITTTHFKVEGDFNDENKEELPGDIWAQIKSKHNFVFSILEKNSLKCYNNQK